MSSVIFTVCTSCTGISMRVFAGGYQEMTSEQKIQPSKGVQEHTPLEKVYDYGYGFSCNLDHK